MATNPGLGETLAARAVQGGGNVPLHVHRDVVIGIHHGRKAVQVNDLLVSLGVDPHRGKFLQFIAHADNHIRLIEAEIDIIVHHETHGPQGVRVIVRKDALAVEGRGHRNLQPFGETDQGLLGLVARRPVSGQDDGALGRLQHRGGLGDLGGGRGLGMRRMNG